MTGIQNSVLWTWNMCGQHLSCTAHANCLRKCRNQDLTVLTFGFVWIMMILEKSQFEQGAWQCAPGQWTTLFLIYFNGQEDHAMFQWQGTGYGWILLRTKWLKCITKWHHKVTEMYHKVIQMYHKVTQMNHKVTQMYHKVTQMYLVYWYGLCTGTGVDTFLVFCLFLFQFFPLFHWGAWIIWKFIYEFVAMWQNNDLVAIGKITIC